MSRWIKKGGNKKKRGGQTLKRDPLAFLQFTPIIRGGLESIHGFAHTLTTLTNQSINQPTSPRSQHLYSRDTVLVLRRVRRNRGEMKLIYRLSAQGKYNRKERTLILASSSIRMLEVDWGCPKTQNGIPAYLWIVPRGQLPSPFNRARLSNHGRPIVSIHHASVFRYPTPSTVPPLTRANSTRFFRLVPRLPSSPPRTNFLPLYPFHSFLWLSAPYQDKKKIITASISFPLKYTFLSYSLIFLTSLCLIFYCISRLIILRNFFIFS